MPDYPDAAYCTVAPDWACEALSPSTLRVDRHGKPGIHARAGVSHLWPVDPDARTLEALGLRDGRRALLATPANGDPVSLPPLDAITFPLDALWPESAAWDGGHCHGSLMPVAALARAQSRYWCERHGVGDEIPSIRPQPNVAAAQTGERGSSISSRRSGRKSR